MQVCIPSECRNTYAHSAACDTNAVTPANSFDIFQKELEITLLFNRDARSVFRILTNLIC